MFAVDASRGDNIVVADRNLPQARTEAPPVVPIRQLGFRELVDLPFALIQANLTILAGFTVATFLVAELAAVGIAVAAEQLNQVLAVWTIVLSTACIAWLARVFLRGVTTVVGLDPLAHRRPDRWATLAAVRRRAGPLLIAGIVQTLLALATLVAATVVALVFPPSFAGLGWVRARWALIPAVIVAESASFPTASKRSRLLVRPAHGTLGRQWLAHRLVLSVAMLPLAGSTAVVIVLAGTEKWTLITLVLAAVLAVVIGAEVVESAARAVAYVDRRCRREAFDVQVPGYTPAAAR